MKTEEKKVVSINSTNTFSNLGIGVYTVYDTVLQQFEPPVCLPNSKVRDYFSIIVNDVASRYYNHEVDYIIYKIGDFKSDTGEILNCLIERLSGLDSYIDNEKRKLQTIVQVLNFLPSGYFKMPDEQKKVIQERIDEATIEYISNYVIPDLDLSQFDTSKVVDIYKNYDKYIS